MIRKMFLLLGVLANLSVHVVADDALELAGLWEARQYFGPETYRRLVIREVEDRLIAEVGGHRMTATVDDQKVRVYQSLSEDAPRTRIRNG